MQLKMTTDYAIQIVLYLATARGVASSRQISDDLGIPQSTIFKIGRQLCNCGMVTTCTGVQGGFSLTKDPKDIYLYDIIVRFEPTVKISECLEDDNCCKRYVPENSSVQELYADIQNKLEGRLKSVSISSLI